MDISNIGNCNADQGDNLRNGGNDDVIAATQAARDRRIINTIDPQTGNTADDGSDDSDDDSSDVE